MLKEQLMKMELEKFDILEYNKLSYRSDCFAEFFYDSHDKKDPDFKSLWKLYLKLDKKLNKEILDYEKKGIVPNVDTYNDLAEIVLCDWDCNECEIDNEYDDRYYALEEWIPEDKEGE